MGWLADLYGTAFITLAGAMVQTVAGLPLFLALESDPTSVANLFVTGNTPGRFFVSVEVAKKMGRVV